MIFMRQAGTSRRAFTIAELLVATVITATALTGVYAVFRQAMAVEVKASRALRDRSAAVAVADHLAMVLTHTVNPPELAAIECQQHPAGGFSLECHISGSSYLGPDADHSSIQRRRYSWGGASGNTGDGDDVTLMLQIQPYSGTQNITPLANIEELDPRSVWELLPATVIAERIADLSVQFMQVNEPTADWTSVWAGNSGDVAVWITVRVGGQTVERFVTPRADAPMIE